MVRPSSNSDSILYDDLYHAKLEKEVFDKYYVVSNCFRGLTTDIVNSEQFIYDYISSSKSDYFIFHLGICDCTPRLFSVNQKRFLKLLDLINLNFIKNLIIKFFSNNRFFFTKLFPKTYVDLNKFFSNFSDIIIKINKANPKSQIIIINIIDTNENNSKRTYNFLNNIRAYNKKIEKIKFKYSNVQILDINLYSKNDLSKFLLEDGIHLTKYGHNFIFEKLKNDFINSKIRLS